MKDTFKTNNASVFQSLFNIISCVCFIDFWESSYGMANVAFRYL